MIQRVFYGSIGIRPDEVPGYDLTAREHLELWPLAALFLLMGIASPLWMRAIDTYGVPTANASTAFASIASQSSSIPTQTLSSRPERSAVERPAGEVATKPTSVDCRQQLCSIAIMSANDFAPKQEAR
jgi:NADH-quinone oxidoreductase subunit M